jgi:hypothetical protein
MAGQPLSAFFFAHFQTVRVFAYFKRPLLLAMPVYAEIGEFSSLYRWARSNTAIRSGVDEEGNSIPASHHSLCAKTKSFHVDEDTLGTFYAKAARAWNEATFLSEEGIGEHILFFDLDILVQTEWLSWHTEQTTMALLYLLSPCLPAEASVIVTAVDPEPVGDDDNRRYKVGMHLYFPDVFVNTEMHVALRKYALVSMHRCAPGHIGFAVSDADVAEWNPETGLVLCKPWSDVLDLSVCQRPKLRLLCSSKAGPCFHTKEERAELQCGPKRHRINLGRRYGVFGAFKRSGDAEWERDGAREERFLGLDTSTAPDTIQRRTELLHLVSLRRCGQLSTICLPEGDAIGQEADELDRGPEAEVEVKGTAVDERIDQMVRFFMHELGLISDLREVQEVLAVKRARKPVLFVVKLGAVFCFNHGESHTCNRVYVHIKRGLELNIRCHHNSARISDQQAKCQDVQAVYFVHNEALEHALFGGCKRTRAPDTQFDNAATAQVDPFMAWAVQWEQQLAAERSRAPGASQAEDEDAS